MKKIFVKAVAFLLIFCALFLAAQEVIRYKDERRQDMCYRYDSYLNEPEGSIDILFIGSSPVYAGIAPPVIWKETGITSINFGSTAATAFAGYYQLRFALENNKPSLVVLDFCGLFQDRRADDEVYEPYYRINVDAIPDRKLKNEMIQQIVNDNENQDLLTYLFPLLQYHSRWNELEEEDFVDTKAAKFKSYKKGAYFRTAISEKEFSYDPEMYEQEFDEEPISEYSWGYYQKTLDLCAENNIPVAAVSYPKGTYKHLIREYKTLERVCAENGLNYYNMSAPAMWEICGLDTETDFYDSGHLNSSGAVKLSKVLAEMLQRDYCLPDHRGDTAYNSWNEDWDAFYTDYKKVLSGFGY